MAKTKKGKTAMSKQTAKLIARIAENLPEMDEVTKQRWIDDPKGLQKFLSGLVLSFGVDDVRSPDAFFQTRSGLYVTDDFRSLVVAKAEPTATIPAFKHVELMRDMNDSEIKEMLGDGHLFTDTEVCALIADLIRKQGGGKKGKLLNNGYANLFYLSSCLVHVSWNAGRREWRVYAWKRDDRRWRRGSQVFSPGN